MKNNYDVAVIGGGPAGMMAAITAAKGGQKTVLIEKNDTLGKKLLLTGNGRCNVCNAEFDLRKLVANYGENGPFLFHCFAKFGPEKVMRFFNSLGVPTVIENKQRVFPKSGKATDILAVLGKELKRNKAEVILGMKVIDVRKQGRMVERLILADREIVARNYIIATGGKSYPGTGSNGDGYEWAHQMGHRIVKLAPALVPINTKEVWTKKLAGLGFENIGITVIQNGKKKLTSSGDCLFTHTGLSGPGILDVSGYAGKLLENGEVIIALDLVSDKNMAEMEMAILAIFRKNLNRTLKNCLAEFVTQNLSEALAKVANVDCEKTVNNVTREERKRLVGVLKSVKLTVTGLMDIGAGMVTNGGVARENVDDKTMKSKVIDNLFFVGEIINVHGKTGGYNLQQCWSTGYLAGQSATDATDTVVV